MERGALQQGDGRDINDGLGNVYGPRAPEGSKAKTETATERVE